MIICQVLCLFHKNAGELTDMQKFRRTVRTGLESSGLNEVIGYSLVTPEKATEFVGELETTSLMMPMTEDRQTLRANMIPGLLDIVNYNQNRKNADVAIYEIGNIFLPNADDIRPTEVPNLAFAISGNVVDKSYNGQAVPVDFYYAKELWKTFLKLTKKLNLFQLIIKRQCIQDGLLSLTSMVAWLVLWDKFIRLQLKI